MKKYLSLYQKLFFFSLKAKLSYRLSFLVKLFYGPMYCGSLLTILLVAYSRTPILGGWDRNEALLLFAVFNMIYTTCLVTFMDSIRYLLWDGIRQGEVDTWLLKPGSTQFYLTFSRPNIDLLSLWIPIFIFFMYKLVNVHSVSIWNWVGFWIVFILAHLIIYFILSTYATLGFYVTKAQQVLEIFDKASDFSQYPISIFPGSIQFALTTFLPIAFYSYVPTLFLRNQGSLFLVGVTIGFTIFLIIINHFAWKHALRNYSSASS